MVYDAQNPLLKEIWRPSNPSEDSDRTPRADKANVGHFNAERPVQPTRFGRVTGDGAIAEMTTSPTICACPVSSNSADAKPGLRQSPHSASGPAARARASSSLSAATMARNLAARRRYNRRVSRTAKGCDDGTSATRSSTADSCSVFSGLAGFDIALLYCGYLGFAVPGPDHVADALAEKRPGQRRCMRDRSAGRVRFVLLIAEIWVRQGDFSHPAHPEPGLECHPIPGRSSQVEFSRSNFLGRTS